MDGLVAILGRPGGGSIRICPECDLVGGIASWWLPSRMQRLQESHEGGRFRWAQILTVGRHVAAALDHLADQLTRRQSYRHSVERRSALASNPFEGMAVAALLRLKDERAPALQRAAFHKVLGGDGVAAPRVHHGTPWRVLAQSRESSEGHRDE